MAPARSQRTHQGDTNAPDGNLDEYEIEEGFARRRQGLVDLFVDGRWRQENSRCRCS